MSGMSFRNSQGELVEVPSVPASRFKNEFGAVFEQAALGGAVAITKHDAPKAVLVSYAEFQALVKARSQGLEELSDEFDALLARLQTPKAKKGLAAAFDAAPLALGRAAARAALAAASAKKNDAPRPPAVTGGAARAGVARARRAGVAKAAGKR